MNTVFTVQTRSGHRLRARAPTSTPSWRPKTLIKRRKIDHDHGCKQRNGPPPLDYILIQAVVNLDS